MTLNQAGQYGYTADVLGDVSEAFVQALDTDAVNRYEDPQDRYAAAFAMVDPKRAFGMGLVQSGAIAPKKLQDAEYMATYWTGDNAKGYAAYQQGMDKYAQAPSYRARQTLALVDAFAATGQSVPEGLRQQGQAILAEAQGRQSRQGRSDDVAMTEVAPPLRADGSVDIDALGVDGMLTPPGPRGDGQLTVDNGQWRRPEPAKPAGYINGKPMWRKGEKPDERRQANISSFKLYKDIYGNYVDENGQPYIYRNGIRQ